MTTEREALAAECKHPQIITYAIADEGPDHGQPAGLWGCAVCSRKFVPLEVLAQPAQEPVMPLRYDLVTRGDRQVPVWSRDDMLAAYDAGKRAGIAAAPPAPAQPTRCHLCDNTGDIHDATGEWRGECPYCKAQPTAQPELSEPELPQPQLLVESAQGFVEGWTKSQVRSAINLAVLKQRYAQPELSDEQIDCLDTFALHWMAPCGKESVRDFARAIERALKGQP